MRPKKTKNKNRQPKQGSAVGRETSRKERKPRRKSQ
jgi:hypothetical protein